MNKEWQITETLAPTQTPCSVRTLLEKQWLLPRRFTHFLRINKNVIINGHYRNMNDLVSPHDQVTLTFTGAEFRTAVSSYRPSPQAHIDVLYENRDLLVINKPAGKKSHPNYPGEMGTVLNDVAAYLQPQGLAPYIVHRLDQQTSGALIVAKNPIVVPILDRLISMGAIHREYLALATGQITPATGKWTWSIGRDPDDRRKRAVAGPKAQHAQTNYQVLGTTATTSLVKLTLATGRTHQIRVHLAHSGHPIVNDPLYNPLPATGPMFLHGKWLRLSLPFSGEKLTLTAPEPAFFSAHIHDIIS